MKNLLGLFYFKYYLQCLIKILKKKLFIIHIIHIMSAHFWGSIAQLPVDCDFIDVVHIFEQIFKCP